MLSGSSIYSFKVEGLEGGVIDFSKYKGKKILIVNTASKCGYTSQYEELEQLSKKYKGKLVVIGFPANNFGAQESGTNEEISAFCKRNYGVSFPMAAKVSVAGSDTHPLFKFLSKKAKALGTPDPIIKWPEGLNFIFSRAIFLLQFYEWNFVSIRNIQFMIR